MFTGIIEKLARISAMRRGQQGARLTVDLEQTAEGVRPGDSIAINGACLTVAAIQGTAVTFNVVAETLRRTNLGDLRSGDRVNVERALRVGDRLAGHFVQGHVDGLGRISRKETGSEGGSVTIAAQPDIMAFMVEKGSVAVDGISLTVASLTDSDFTIALIPTTLQTTTLGFKAVGAAVNLEIDILAKLVARLLRERGMPVGGITEQWLRDQGFA